MNPDESTIIIDRSAAQKLARIDALRQELKPLGYTVVLTNYLAALTVQAKRLQAKETA
jgi:hypothetical protein